MSILKVSRRKNESILIGEDIKVTIHDLGSGNIKIGVEAPLDTKILREEVYNREHGIEQPIIDIPIRSRSKGIGLYRRRTIRYRT